MANWAYHVYTFEMIEGQKNVLMQEIEAHRERLMGLLQLVGECTRVGKPHTRTEVDEVEGSEDEEAAQYDDTDPTLSLRGAAYDGTLHTAHAIVALGERGLHDYATNPEDGADRLDVGSRTAETPMRVDFYFATAMTKGFIVAETLGMKDAVPPLVRWINALSREQRRCRLADVNAVAEHRDAEGEVISKNKALKSVPPVFKIRVERATDPQLLQSIVDDMTSMDADFIQIDENGKERTHRLTIKVETKEVREGVVRRFKNTKLTPDTIITQTLKDLDVDAESLEKANLGVNQIKAHVRSPHGSKTLVPGQLADLFNYKFKFAGRPRTTPYYGITINKINSLRTTSQVALKIPDETELVEWIEREEESWEGSEEKATP